MSEFLAYNQMIDILMLESKSQVSSAVICRKTLISIKPCIKPLITHKKISKELQKHNIFITNNDSQQ